jgi:hydrogenase nickel incorporation protein HypA/HybF
MHELGIASELFKIALKKAGGNNLKIVTKLVIKVGVASGIEKDFLRHSFTDHILPKTIAEGAELELVEEPVEIKCRNCGKKISTQDGPKPGCPRCGSFNTEITKGKDVYLESIEGDA